MWPILLVVQQIGALIACIIIGQEKNRNGFLWGFFFGSLGLLILALLPPLKEETSEKITPRGRSPNQRILKPTEKKCKSCGSIITDDYTKCPYCGSGEFYDENINLSEVGRLIKTSTIEYLICPVCETKNKLDMPINDFKKMKCIRCHKTITPKNALYE
jgi:uncharacterized paraquat-inducible protein A